jgi:hypothetical protein
LARDHAHQDCHAVSLEALHPDHSPFDKPMVLRHDVVRVSRLSDLDGLSLDALVQIQYGRSIGVTTVNVDACWNAVVVDGPLPVQPASPA